jgi:hypothetical protein
MNGLDKKDGKNSGGNTQLPLHKHSSASFTLSLPLVLVLVSGCAGLPSLQQVQHSFEKEHPGTSVTCIDGSLTNYPGRMPEAQFHIYYAKAEDAKQHEDVWSYKHAAEMWLAPKKETIR